jgi:hypothetical protein
MRDDSDLSIAAVTELSPVRSKNSPMIVTVTLSSFAPAKVRTGMFASFAGAKGDSPLTDALLIRAQQR